jgi:hypothetical protein
MGFGAFGKEVRLRGGFDMFRAAADRALNSQTLKAFGNVN